MTLTLWAGSIGDRGRASQAILSGLTRDALLAVAGIDADLDRSLADLMRAELIREQRRLPEPAYLFKHALTQEAAYAGILLDERRHLHRRLAQYLERRPDARAEGAALLAHHWRLGEEWKKALEYTVLAAERARRLYARPEAIALYWQALELLDRLPRTEQRGRSHIDVVLGLVSTPGWERNAAGRMEGLRQIDRAIESAAQSGRCIPASATRGEEGAPGQEASRVR